MSTPVAMSSSNGQAAHSCPNSCAGVDVTQAGSSLPASGISCSGSTMSLTGLSQAGSLVSGTVLPRSGSSVPSGVTSQLGSSSSAALPKMNSSFIQSADNYCPAALRFSKAVESGSNNNDVYYHGTVVMDTVPLDANKLGGKKFGCNLETNNNYLSDSDKSQDNNNNIAGNTQQPTDIVQEWNPMHQFNQQEQVS
jgi:hypothetical protein